MEPTNDTLELRECKRCLKILKTAQMYHFVDHQIFYNDTIGVICQDCADQAGEPAAKEAMKRENDKYAAAMLKVPSPVTVGDLPKGKIK